MQPYLQQDPIVISISPRFQPVIAIFCVSGVMLFFGWFDPGVATFAFILSGWMVSLCIHEFCHAFAAYLGGDRSVIGSGYLSFDPMRYVDPQVSFLLPLLVMTFGGIGLPGGAVYLNPGNLKKREWASVVSAAGPAGTALVMFALLVPLWFGLDKTMGQEAFWGAWSFLAFLQISALFLNLLPIPGLDGYGILEPHLPADMSRSLWKFKMFAPLLFFCLFLFIPAFGRAFLETVYSLGDLLGLDLGQVLFGWHEFRFWK